ncbi:MAG: hypothetical protein M1833_005707 [Piccolia ochrophora]|nr:MAG: hypothetical protein M1833_005707 [Piccolia ochrophora]
MSSPTYTKEDSVGDAEKAASVGDANTTSDPTTKMVKHSKDADEALKAFAGLDGEEIHIDEETNRKLLRKIDWNLMPLLCVVYGLNYLDKTTLSYASVMGLKQDIGLVGDQYQWLGSMFYFGYLGWEYPTNRLLQRLPLAKYSAFNVIMYRHPPPLGQSWGATLCCLAAVQNFSGAVAVRFFLGVFEAAVSPGFALFTSQWYTIGEQGLRTGIWFSFNGWGQIFGGFLAYGIAVGSRVRGSTIAPWKIVFLATGLLTMTLGVIFLFVMPDNQLNARFLTKEERVLAIARIRGNQQGVGNKHFKLYQLKEALLDPLTWAFTFYACAADIPNGGITNFFNQLIVSFGYSEEESLLYGTPGGAVEVVALVACGYLGDRYRNRILISMSGLVLSILGMVLIVALPLGNAKGRLAGYYLTQASPTPFVALLSLIATNVAGYTKKTTVAALYLIAYCAGNIIGPQTFRPKDAPRYVPAEITIIVCWAACLVDLGFIYWYCRRQNAKKAGVRAATEYVKLENQEWLDLRIRFMEDPSTARASRSRPSPMRRRQQQPLDDLDGGMGQLHLERADLRRKPDVRSYGRRQRTSKSNSLEDPVAELEAALGELSEQLSTLSDEFDNDTAQIRQYASERTIAELWQDKLMPVREPRRAHREDRDERQHVLQRAWNTMHRALESIRSATLSPHRCGGANLMGAARVLEDFQALPNLFNAVMRSPAYADRFLSQIDSLRKALDRTSGSEDFMRERMGDAKDAWDSCDSDVTERD